MRFLAVPAAAKGIRIEHYLRLGVAGDFCRVSGPLPAAVDGRERRERCVASLLSRSWCRLRRGELLWEREAARNCNRAYRRDHRVHNLLFEAIPNEANHLERIRQ